MSREGSSEADGVSAQPDRGAIAFAERLIALLDEGTFTATYKFAHPGCNNSKRDFLAATRHLEAWLPRFDPSSDAGRTLRDAGDGLVWDTHPRQTLSVARAIYLRVPPAARLWLARDEFEAAVPERIAELLAS